MRVAVVLVICACASALVVALLVGTTTDALSSTEPVALQVVSGVTAAVTGAVPRTPYPTTFNWTALDGAGHLVPALEAARWRAHNIACRVRQEVWNGSTASPAVQCTSLDPRFLLYLRIPKAGSLTVSRHIDLAWRLRPSPAHWYSDHNDSWTRRPEADLRRGVQVMLRTARERRWTRVAYGQHLLWADMGPLGLAGSATQSIQVFRHPVARFVSAYYYLVGKGRCKGNWCLTHEPLPAWCQLPVVDRACATPDGTWNRSCVREECRCVLPGPRWGRVAPYTRSMLLDECLRSPRCLMSDGEGVTSLRAAGAGQPDWMTGTPVPIDTPWDHVQSRELRLLLLDQSRNLNTKWLCGTDAECMDSSSPQALQRAVKRLYSEYAVVGVLEHMDESLGLMATRFPKYFPLVKPSKQAAAPKIRANRNRHPPPSPFALQLLTAWNANDLALYAEAEHLLHASLRQCLHPPTWQPKSFLRRCP